MITKLFIGAGAPFAAIAINHTAVNAWLQTASFVVGITVGILTILSILRNGKK